LSLEISMSGRERIMAHLRGEPLDCLPCMPITMQFAARLTGRPYRDYATDYRVLVEGQCRVAEAYDFDYVNTMSDPACEAADCGAVVVFQPDQPPAIDEAQPLLADKTTLALLQIPDPTAPGRMHNRLQALALYRERSGRAKLVEGWIEGPCAEAADLRGLHNLMLDFYDDPAFVRDLFAFCLEMELRFAREQVAAGAEMIGIGDAAASLVGPRLYEEFVWPFERQMVDGVHTLGVPARLHICGNTRRILAGMGRLGCEIVDLDFLAPLAEGRAQMGPEQVLLGNLDPVRVLREGSAQQVYDAMADCHRAAGPRYIAGAGCEVPVDTPAANLRALIAYARNHRPEDLGECWSSGVME
jgi:MtaA/CmuA family methyltransferase